jgi:hypothetical protein
MLSNLWSAHYAKLAATSKDDDKLSMKYSLVLPRATLAGTCRENFISVPDCVVMLISPSGQVQLIHHTHWDKSTPVYTDSSNSLWTLVGIGNFPPVATFDYRALAKSIQDTPVPTWAAMHDLPQPLLRSRPSVPQPKPPTCR